MATAKQLQEQFSREDQQFQADIDASVMYHDPLPNGLCWTVTMPQAEYQARQEEIQKLRVAVREAKDTEQTELALDQFLHEPE